MQTRCGWLAIVANFLTPWIGPHIDRYSPVGRVLFQAGAEDADRGFWVVAAVALGAGYRVLDIALACRVPISEACVWCKACFPLTLSVSMVALGGTATGLLYAVLIRRPHRPSGGGAA